MSHVAIVPARAGSKSIPSKNLRILSGTSLVHRALLWALGTELFHKVVLTTDIPILLEEQQTRWKILERRPELATDDAPMTVVVLDVLERMKLKEEDTIWLLQPTSPFRVPGDYVEILELLRSSETRSVISVTAVGDSDPSRHYTLTKNGDLNPILAKKAKFENRQNLKPVYERNGLFYVTTVKDFQTWGSLFIPRCRPYFIPKSRSANLNDLHRMAADANRLIQEGAWK